MAELQELREAREREKELRESDRQEFIASMDEQRMMYK